MSLLKDISVEIIIKMSENVTANEMINEVELIELVIERVKESEEDFQKFFHLADWLKRFNLKSMLRFGYVLSGAARFCKVS
jgi:hypothetical protein